MSGPTLKKALLLVETLGLPPLSRIANTMPRDYLGGRYMAWDKRRAEVENEVVERLCEQGARFSVTSMGTRIAFFGITATSATSLQQALKHWKAAAEKRLNAIGGGR